MIINEIFYEGVNKYFAQIQQGLDEVQRPDERLRVFLARAITTIAENREFFKVYIAYLTREADRPEVQKMVTTFYDRFIEEAGRELQDGITQGVFKNIEVEDMARAFYFLTVGTLFTRYTMKVDFDVERQNDFQISNILESIRA